VNEPEDIQLLRAIRQGDEAAFQSLYRRHRSGLYSFALLHSGAPDVAADVVQDVFMGLLNDSYGFDPLKGMLANFLYGVARNLVLSHARQNRRWVQPAAGEDDADDGLEPADPAAGPLARVLDDEAAEHLRRALALLAPHYRDVVILFELHEKSYQEIAQICQLEIGTVRSRLARGRAALGNAHVRQFVHAGVRRHCHTRRKPEVRRRPGLHVRLAGRLCDARHRARHEIAHPVGIA
jgi:RNA polymerase sigma-70 factor (ECF subfamily)